MDILRTRFSDFHSAHFHEMAKPRRCKRDISPMLAKRRLFMEAHSDVGSNLATKEVNPFSIPKLEDKYTDIVPFENPPHPYRTRRSLKMNGTDLPMRFLDGNQETNNFNDQNEESPNALQTDRPTATPTGTQTRLEGEFSQVVYNLTFKKLGVKCNERSVLGENI